MKFIDKRKYLLIYWLVIANFVIPILCMDSFETGGKRMKNTGLVMPGTQVPPIIPLKPLHGQKKSKNDQVYKLS